MATVAVRIGERPGARGSVARRPMVFMPAGRFDDGPAYSNALGVALARRIWRDGDRPAKAGAIATEPIAQNDARPSLFPAVDRRRSARPMAALDSVNSRMGRGTLRLLGAGATPA